METIRSREGLQMASRNLDYAAVEASLVEQLRAYATSARQRGYVVGVSGGVDSAVVSTLAARTGLPIYVMEMPIHQREAEVSRAQDHIAWLKAHHPNVTEWREDLSQVFDLMAEKIETVASTLDGAGDTKLALANTRSRLRMVSLYAMAGTFGLLVAGTGNKVEDYGIGFFTKYGDGGVDVSPIGELYKSEVRSLGRHMGILPALTEAVPTDGLHTDGATDEDQIGASYDELEWAMGEHAELESVRASNFAGTDRTTSIEWSQRTFSGRAREVMDTYLSRHYQNSHKMAMPPVFQVPIK